MTQVENARRVIRFDSPEWIPVTLPIYNVSFHNSRDEPYVHKAPPKPQPPGTTSTDIWGTVTHYVHDAPGGSHRIGVLPTPDKLRGFPWPDPNDERICASIYQQFRDFPGGDWWISGGHASLLWEIANPMIGMENLLEYFYSEPNFVKEVFHRIMDFHLGLARHYVKLGVGSVGFSDDLAMQSGPFFSPAILDEFFKPEYRRIFDFYKQHQVIIGQHCCGKIDGVLDFFLDLGLDILNPIQVTCNDLAEVRRRTQGRMALHGGISNVTISNGPVEAIEAEVRRHLWLLGRHGGYFPAVDHSMPAPQEHRRAWKEAVEKWGRYPLTPPPDGSEEAK